MSDLETDFDEGTSEKKPRRTRKRNEERRVFVYRMIDGKPKEQGAFPETAIGTPLERRVPMFLKELFGEGDYRMEIRKPNGHFERAFDVSIATEPDRAAESARQNVIEFEPEEDFEEEQEDFAFAENDGQTNALQLQLLIEREKTKQLQAESKRLEADLQAVKVGNQNEMQTTVSALEKAHERYEALMMTMFNQQQKPQQPQSNQADLIVEMLKGTLAVQRGVRELSEEIAPQETSSGSTYLGDAAKLIDSLGKNAGTFLPLFLNRSTPTAKPPTAPKTPASKATNGNQSGELSDLLAKVKNKKAGETK